MALLEEITADEELSELIDQGLEDFGTESLDRDERASMRVWVLERVEKLVTGFPEDGRSAARHLREQQLYAGQEFVRRFELREELGTKLIGPILKRAVAIKDQLRK